MATGELVQIIVFALCAFITIAGAIGVTTTMSMFRSGIFLMASFVGVAGLFILLAADLIALLQIMMYIGGMLVMIMFMVLFMEDPGGAMMATMPDMMGPIGRIFSSGLQQEQTGKDDNDGQGKHGSSGDVDHGERGSAGKEHAGHDRHGQPASMSHEDMQQGGMKDGGMEHGAMDKGEMDMDMDMSMVTPARRVAAWLAAAICAGLTALILLRPAWPVLNAVPDPRSAEMVGTLLMGKYMVAFEGAGFLILVGIFGAVFLSRVKYHPGHDGRDARVAQAGSPPEIEPEPFLPQFPVHDNAAVTHEEMHHQDKHEGGA